MLPTWLHFDEVVLFELWRQGEHSSSYPKQKNCGGCSKMKPQTELSPTETFWVFVFCKPTLYWEGLLYWYVSCFLYSTVLVTQETVSEISGDDMYWYFVIILKLWVVSSYITKLQGHPGGGESNHQIIADLDRVNSSDFTGGHLEKIQMDVHVQLAEVCLFILFDVIGIDLSLSKSWPNFWIFFKGYHHWKKLLM